ncbi:LIC11213 family lipoprotein [Leptospira sp. 'Mane']|uniref:LIC11213 family lipoprotein n=1 Tax=Leptospira sp. 'Mane' TaxID=3387407 RepID=UPI00398B4B18
MLKLSVLSFTCFISLLAFTDCTNEKASEKDKDTALQAALLAQVTKSGSSSSGTSTGKFPIPTCEVAPPTFSSLATAGFNTTCGKSGCHDGTERYNVTDYATIKSRYTVAGFPTTSSLYIAQSTGSMAVNTNQAIDKAIYCWILGGANP